MTTSRETLARLLSEGKIALGRSAFLDSEPDPASPPDWDRVEGMLLGLAVGDALGAPLEGLLPATRRARHLVVRDYLPRRGAPGTRAGLPTDDTQLSFWTLEQLLEDGALDPSHLARRFAADRIDGIGSGTAEFLEKLHRGRPWEECAARSAGNGALMRVAPLLLPHLPSPSPLLWADVAVAARLTHDDSASTASCLAFADLLWKALRTERPPEPSWWADRFLAVLRPLETGATYSPRGGEWREAFEGPLSAYLDLVLGEARAGAWGTVDALERWWSGAFLLETVPTVLWILERHAHDPEEAILRAVNDAKDADTAGAIVGAAVGALHGRKRLPARWLVGLSGRTRPGDDGDVFDLISRARERWGPAAR